MGKMGKNPERKSRNKGDQKPKDKNMGCTKHSTKNTLQSPKDKKHFGKIVDSGFVKTCDELIHES